MPGSDCWEDSIAECLNRGLEGDLKLPGKKETYKVFQMGGQHFPGHGGDRGHSLFKECRQFRVAGIKLSRGLPRTMNARPKYLGFICSKELKNGVLWGLFVSYSI